MGGHVGLILTLARPDVVSDLVLTGSSGSVSYTHLDVYKRQKLNNFPLSESRFKISLE